MANEVGREYRLEVQSTLGTAKTITAITKANPGVATSTTHGLANGDYVILKSIEGMSQANYLVARVANKATDTFELEGVDTTNWGTFTSGSAYQISAWTSVTQATSVDYGAGSAEEIDVTTLLDVTRRTENGLLALPAVTVNVLADISSTAQAAIESAAYSASVLAWRATTKGGRKRIWAGTPSTIGESVQVNSAITGSFTITVKSSKYCNFAS